MGGGLASTDALGEGTRLCVGSVLQGAQDARQHVARVEAVEDAHEATRHGEDLRVHGRAGAVLERLAHLWGGREGDVVLLEERLGVARLELSPQADERQALKPHALRLGEPREVEAGGEP